MPQSDGTSGNGNPSERQSFWVLALRGITPATIIAVFIAVVEGFSGIQASINRNCDATADVGRVVSIVAGIDNELNDPENYSLRAELRRQLHDLPDC